MEYRLPTYADEQGIKEYLRECRENGEKDVIMAQDILVSDYKAWVNLVQDNANKGNAEWGKSLLLLCTFHNKILGILCIRYGLSEDLAEIYGHIGYSVRPSERKKGYASQMLKNALAICKSKNMDKVLLGCYRDNVASNRVITKCGGKLLCENDNYEKGRISRYYAIELSQEVD